MSNEFEDKEVECIEETCENGNTFTWPAGEQQFFHDKGLYQPKRCKDCRTKKRNEKAEV